MKMIKNQDLIYFDIIENALGLDREQSVKLKFSCYSDGDYIWTYDKSINGKYIEICIIAEQNEWFRKEELHKLLSKKNIKYLGVRVFKGEEIIYNKDEQYTTP